MFAKNYKSIQDAINNKAYSFAVIDRVIEETDGSFTFVYKTKGK